MFRIKLSLKNQKICTLTAREFETGAGLLYAEAIEKVPAIEKEKHKIKFGREGDDVLMDLTDLSEALQQQLVEAGYVPG